MSRRVQLFYKTFTQIKTSHTKKTAFLHNNAHNILLTYYLIFIQIKIKNYRIN